MLFCLEGVDDTLLVGSEKGNVLAYDIFNGKLGQHVNWDSVQAKKLSPAKVGAFGQAGQLASKIKHLMENAG